MEVKTVTLVFAVFLTCPALGNQSWYDTEIVHNTVHDLQEAAEKFPSHKDVPPSIKAPLGELKKVVDHLHDELHSERENDAVMITKAFSTIQEPLDRFSRAVRAHQVQVKLWNAYLYDTLPILGAYTELKFWMTKVE